MAKIATIIGAGSWGTALGLELARQDYRVGLWVYEPDLAAAMASGRENTRYLPGFRLPEGVQPTPELRDALTPSGLAPERQGGAALVILAVPSQALRAVLTRLRPLLPPAAELVLATKGLEENSLLRVSEVTADVLGAAIAPRLATLSGPTFAREVAACDPAAVVLAAEAPALAHSLQQRLSSARLRLYTSSDVTGVELAASLKNVIAIASGICHGLGLGSNTRAALVARGLAEMTRLAVAAGGLPETLAGLAGLGDLVLTCTGELSRNRALGIALGQGATLSEALAATPMVAEGVPTTAAAARLAAHWGVEMPIVEQMRRVLFERLPPRQALAELMQRALKAE